MVAIENSKSESPAAGRSSNKKGLGGVATAEGEMDTMRVTTPGKIQHLHPSRLAANSSPQTPLIMPVALHLLQLRPPSCHPLRGASINLGLPVIRLVPPSPTSPIGSGGMEFIPEKQATQMSLRNSAC